MIQEWLRQSQPIDELSLPPSPVSFAELWAPVARGASAALASRPMAPPEASVLADLSEDLLRRLSEVGEGAVWEHFNDRRTLGELLRAQLEADERGVRRTVYRRVVEALRADGLEALTARRPVLERRLCATVAWWLESSHEMFLALERDRDLLTKTFAIPASARLIGAKTGLSDPHRGGRSVAILTFAAGRVEPVSVVFKPRDLRIDAAYHELIRELSGAAPDLAPLRSLTVLPRDGYGYVEHVAHGIASTDEEMGGFYRNAGRLTAILYALGCNDCHNENVIADRDQLILVDAETLLQGAPRADAVTPGRSAARNALEARLGDSVIRIGLLPRWFFLAKERTPRDLSALGINPPAAETETYRGWSDLNTDGMATGPATRRSRLPKSLPVGIGGVNRLGDFKADYRAGFRRQIEVIASNRARWLEGLERFRSLRSRFVRRPTWVYLQILGELLQPEALRDEAAQSEALMRAAADDSLSDVHRDAVLAAERAQLNGLDVPYFEHAIAGHDLLLGDAGVSPDFFAESGLDAARRRIGSLGADAIRAQLALIDGSLAAKARRAHRAPPKDPSKRDPALGAPSAAERLAGAATVTDLLIEASISDEAGDIE